MAVNGPSTKQLLNNFLGWFFRKAWTILGARVKNGLFIKKDVMFSSWNQLKVIDKEVIALLQNVP